MKVNRDFEINGAKFHLNDGKGIFCKSKYILMYYVEDFGWIEITGSVNNIAVYQNEKAAEARAKAENRKCKGLEAYTEKWRVEK